MEAIILAGGFGTRLAHIVKDVPKPMAPVANRPFLEYILDYLKDNGITKVILATGYKHSIIESYFNNSYNGIEIEYSVEDKPLFTGGAIKKALEKSTDSEVFIINGDTYFNVDLKIMKEFHIYNQSDITVATKEMSNFDRYGTVILDNNRIVEFKEKQKTIKGLINGGVYLINKKIFNNIKEEKFSFETDIMEKGTYDLSINSFRSNGYFIDIGVESDYYIAQKYFIKKKAIFLDRDGVINLDKKYLYKIEDFEFIDGIFDVLKYFQKENYLLIIITNQAGIGRGYYTEDDFEKLNQWMLNEFNMRGIKIDKVYYCPDHPTHGIGKYKKDSFDRKPNPGMILKAAEELNIDLGKSILIGDKDTDIEAGINANIGTNVFVNGIYSSDCTKADICVNDLRSILERI